MLERERNEDSAEKARLFVVILLVIVIVIVLVCVTPPERVAIGRYDCDEHVDLDAAAECCHKDATLECR